MFWAAVCGKSLQHARSELLPASHGGSHPGDLFGAQKLCRGDYCHDPLEQPLQGGGLPPNRICEAELYQTDLQFASRNHVGFECMVQASIISITGSQEDEVGPPARPVSYAF